MKWWVIVNPSAGRPKELRQRAEAALTRLGVDFELHISQRPEHVSELIAAGHRAGIDRYAGVGGDGTAHLILNGLMSHSWEGLPRLGILPAGTGSDFIRTFALPRSLEDAAVHLATDDWYTTDVLRVEGSFGVRYALNAVEAGVGAAAVTTAARLPRWFGSKRYAVSFWLALPRFQPGTVTATVSEHRQISGQAIAAIVANGQFFGGGMNIAPRASVADGLVDVQVISGPRRKALTVMPRVIRGMHLRHKNVRRTTGKTVRIEVPESWPIEADGELLGSGSISVTVLPAAIEFKI